MACFIVVIMIMVWRNPGWPPFARVPMHERQFRSEQLPSLYRHRGHQGHLRRHVQPGRRRHRRVHMFYRLVMGRLSWSIVTSGLNDTGKTISMAFTASAARACSATS
ncbi:MAG: hypothetical protein ACLRWP_11760 [Bilophila wadsworthia]